MNKIKIYRLPVSLLCIMFIHYYAYSMDDIVGRTKELVLAHEQDPGLSVPSISVAGCSSVGKSHFSKLLVATLVAEGIAARVLQLDRFLAPLPLDYSLEPHEFNNRYNDPVWQFDHRAVHTALPLVKARTPVVAIPKYDCKAKKRHLVPEDFSNMRVVVLEGIYALTGPQAYNIAQYGNLRIFMTASRGHLYEWYCERQRKRGDDPVGHPFTRWDFEEDYNKVIAPSKANADLVLWQDEQRNYSIQ